METLERPRRGHLHRRAALFGLAAGLGYAAGLALMAAPAFAAGDSAGAAAGSTAAKQRAYKELIEDLVTANHILYHQGVLDGFGHVSVRDPRNPEHFLMSRALAPGQVTAADIMEFDRDGNPVDRRGRSIYSERFIHAEIYKVRPDVNAVVHSHSPTVIPFSVTQVPLLPVMTTGSFLSGGVPIFEVRNVAGMSTMLVSDNARGKALAETLGSRPVALLRGHGDVVVGPDLHLVVSRAIYTEIDARLQLQTTVLGGPVTYIAPEEAAKMEEIRHGYLPGGGHGQDRTWEMWKLEAEGKGR